MIGTDTGVSLLGALLGCPLVCFRKEDGSPNMLSSLAIPSLEKKKIPYRYLGDGWTNIDGVLDAATDLLRKV